MRRALTFCIALAAVFVCRGAAAAEAASPLAVRGDTRPSFQITPLVQRFSARQGQRIKFSFEVQTLGQPQSLQVRVVSLKQQLNGLVVADESAPPPDAVQLFGPQKLDLKAEQAATIRGHLDVPLSPAPFLAYGILVTDLGRPFQAGPPAGGEQTGIAVRFVTQYLLRVEVEVKGNRHEHAKELRLESGSLVEREGQPVVEVDVANPTEANVEFQLHCRLLDHDGAPCTGGFGLAMPVRASRPQPQRYESVVFGKGRVRLAAPVPDAVFPGHYQLELKWISRGRNCGKSTIAVSVREGDFPAQGSRFAQVAEGIRVTPSQIALSSQRGGSRRLPLRIDNHSTQSVQFRLAARNLDGTVADWVLFQPSDFLLSSGRGRNVLVTAQLGSDVESHHYGLLRIDALVGQTSGIRDLPLALLPATPLKPSVETGAVRWDPQGDRPAFAMAIDNRGPVHLPLNGRLTFSDLSGQKIEISGGFDRWLLPGKQDELRFPLHRRPSPGTYSVKVQIQQGEGLEPITINQQVQVQ